MENQVLGHEKHPCSWNPCLKSVPFKCRTLMQIIHMSCCEGGVHSQQGCTRYEFNIQGLKSEPLLGHPKCLRLILCHHPQLKEVEQIKFSATY